MWLLDLLNFAEAFERGGKGVNKQILDDEDDEGIFDFGEENEDDAEEESEEDQDEDDDEDNETDVSWTLPTWISKGYAYLYIN